MSFGFGACADFLNGSNVQKGDVDVFLHDSRPLEGDGDNEFVREDPEEIMVLDVITLAVANMDADGAEGNGVKEIVC